MRRQPVGAPLLSLVTWVLQSTSLCSTSRFPVLGPKASWTGVCHSKDMRPESGFENRELRPTKWSRESKIQTQMSSMMGWPSMDISSVCRHTSPRCPGPSHREEWSRTKHR